MITRHGNCLPELEAVAGQPDTVKHAKQLIAKLENSSSELKSIHFLVIDLIDAKEERALDKEQDNLDLIDDDVTSFLFHLQLSAITKSDPPDPSIGRKTTMSRELTHLEKSLSTTED